MKNEKRYDVMNRTEHELYTQAFKKWTSVIEENTSIAPEAYNDYKVKEVFVTATAQVYLRV